MASDYLMLPLRSLRDLAGEVREQADALEERQADLMQQHVEADLELRFSDADTIGDQISALGDELGPLLSRLDEIEEEIAWAERGNDYKPMVL